MLRSRSLTDEHGHSTCTLLLLARCAVMYILGRWAGGSNPSLLTRRTYCCHQSGAIQEKAMAVCEELAVCRVHVRAQQRAHIQSRQAGLPAFALLNCRRLCCSAHCALFRQDPSHVQSGPALETSHGGGVLRTQLLLQRSHVLRRQAAAPLVAQVPHLARRLLSLVSGVPVRCRQRPRGKHHPVHTAHASACAWTLRSDAAVRRRMGRLSISAKIGTCPLPVHCSVQ